MSYSLQEELHDLFMGSEEIFPLSDKVCAERIAEFEQRESIAPLIDKEIVSAWYSAANSFVDSMQKNAWDTLNENSDYTKEQAEKDVARFEAMRPLNQRIAYIVGKLGDEPFSSFDKKDKKRTKQSQLDHEAHVMSYP